jgi:subtilisin family serine protease
MNQIRYIFEYYRSLQELIQAYPSLIFTPITPNIIAVTVPLGANEEFVQFARTIEGVSPPILYGLDSLGALQDANIASFHEYPYGELRGSGILIGFIDTGIQYTNTLFKYEDNTTRIVSIWDQTIEGNPPSPYTYGTEYTRENINAALQSEDPLSIVPSTDEIGHGTFLAGVAAGYDRTSTGFYIGGAPESMMVVVKLRPAPLYLREFYLIQPDAIAYDSISLMEGITYLLDIATRENKPLVICIGVGTNTGPHDGRDRTEIFLNEFSRVRDLVILIAAGNEATLGHHYEGTVLQGSINSFEMNIADGEKGVYFQVWGNAPDKMAISITSPLGRMIPKIPIAMLGEKSFTLPLERTQIIVSYDFTGIYATGQSITIKLIDPTPGLWQFTIHGEYILSGRYNTWLPREGFSLPATRFLRPAPFTTVNIPGTGENDITVGAYDSQDGSVYLSSGRGPTRRQTIKPDFVAPGVNIIGPALDGGFMSATGTSIATAITSSAVALLIEWVKQNEIPIILNTRTVKTILTRGARRTVGVSYPNNLEGYGKLDLQSSILLI